MRPQPPTFKTPGARAAFAIRKRQEGLTWYDVGLAMGVTQERARGIVMKHAHTSSRFNWERTQAYVSTPEDVWLETEAARGIWLTEEQPWGSLRQAKEWRIARERKYARETREGDLSNFDLSGLVLDDDEEHNED
jgi:hypothetical protein